MEKWKRNMIEATKLLFKCYSLLERRKRFEVVVLLMYNVKNIDLTGAYHFINEWENNYFNNKY